MGLRTIIDDALYLMINAAASVGSWWAVTSRTTRSIVLVVIGLSIAAVIAGPIVYSRASDRNRLTAEEMILLDRALGISHGLNELGGPPWWYPDSRTPVRRPAP